MACSFDCYSICRTSFCIAGGAAFVATQTYSLPWMIVGGVVACIASLTIFNPNMRSLFNQEIVLDNQNWAVTLINTTEGTLGHAMLVVEGVSWESPRRIGYDLTNRKEGSKVTRYNYTFKEKNKVGKAHTWIKPRSEIEKLESEMYDESLQRAGVITFGYLSLGNDKNCMTWAKHKLEKLGIKVECITPSNCSGRTIIHDKEFGYKEEN